MSPYVIVSAVVGCTCAVAVIIAGRLKEDYVERFNLLYMEIISAPTYAACCQLDHQIDDFYREFYDRAPEKVSQMTIELAELMDHRLHYLRISSPLNTDSETQTLLSDRHRAVRPAEHVHLLRDHTPHAEIWLQG